MAAKSLSPAEFKRAVRKYERTVPEKIALEVHGIVVLEIYKRVLERTPVLTGRARRNWNISFNLPNPETTEEVAGVLETGVPMTSMERARAREVLRNIHHGKLGTIVWVANYLPYIYFLEHGSSQKAPHGIVEGAIQGGLEALSSKPIKVDISRL